MDGDIGNDKLFGGFGDDILIGGAGDDVAQGGVGRDKLYGADGDDELNGNLGNDELFGGDGHDAMNGGDGNDVFYIDGKDLTEDKIVGGDGHDTLLLTVPTTLTLQTETNHIFGIDVIDASNAPLDITLTPQDILDMTDAGMLTIMGGADDNVVSTGFGWTANGSMQENGHNFIHYECKLNGQGVYLNVEDTVGVALS